tara:strand:+ start:412 stop:633 length:222 start_codon:yes stop_codon:yes gene_type:complete
MKSKDGRSHVSVEQDHWNNIFKEKPMNEAEGYADKMADMMMDAKSAAEDFYCLDCDMHKDEDGNCPECGDDDE